MPDYKIESTKKLTGQGKSWNISVPIEDELSDFDKLKKYILDRNRFEETTLSLCTHIIKFFQVVQGRCIPRGDIYVTRWHHVQPSSN